MARTFGSPIDLLESVVDRLRGSLSLDEGACYLTLDPSAKARQSADLTYIVAPTSGDFDQGLIEGGAIEQLTTRFGFTVTVQSAMKLDEAGHEATFLSHDSRGVLIAAKNVLKHLTNYDPVDGSGNRICRDPISPMNYSMEKGATHSRGSMTLAFQASFDWDMS